jgi:hypothetical protein
MTAKAALARAADRKSGEEKSVEKASSARPEE